MDKHPNFEGFLVSQKLYRVGGMMFFHQNVRNRILCCNWLLLLWRSFKQAALSTMQYTLALEVSALATTHTYTGQLSLLPLVGYKTNNSGVYTVSPKIILSFPYKSSQNINRFSNLVHWHTLWKICNKVVPKYLTTP